MNGLKRTFGYYGLVLLFLVLTGLVLNGCSFIPMYGTYTTSDGDHYAGMTTAYPPSHGYYRATRPIGHGEGIYSWKNGNRYIGQFSEGVRHGYGIMIFKDGRALVGEWRDDKPFGILRAYENGLFLSKVEYRKGKFFSTPAPFGSILKSSFNKKGTKDTEVYDDGAKYEGGLSEGKRDGFGVYTWPDGDKYYGEWRDGKRHGIGSLVRSNGSQWTGKWENGKKIK